MKKIHFALIKTRVFNQLYFLAVYNKSIIGQLVFYSNHTSRFLLGSYLKEAIYSDFVWNTAASIAQVKVESEALFSRFVVQTRLPDVTGWVNLTAKEKRQKVLESQENPATKTNRATNFANLVAARAAQGESNIRGLEAQHEALRNRDLHAVAVHAKAAKTHSMNKETIRLHKLHALLNSKEIVDFLEKPVSFYTKSAAAEIHDRFAQYHGWPTRWNDLAVLPKAHLVPFVDPGAKYPGHIRTWPTI